MPDDVLASILDLYDDTLPYHNRGHALEVRATAARLCGVRLAVGDRVDPEVVELAALLHDAGYSRAPSGGSREAFAATLAADVLSGFGYRHMTVQAVARAILATEAAATPTALEGRVVRAADLSGLASCYETFAENAEALRQEAAVLSGGRPLTTRAWHATVSDVVGRFVVTEGPLFEGLDSSGGSWVSRVQANLSRYVGEGAARE